MNLISVFLKISLVLFTLSLAQGCKYMPFIKYQTTSKKTDLPSFGKYSKLAGANNEFRTCYDVTRYDWEVEVFPESKSISGKMEIWMDIESAQDSLLFDFSRKLKIDSVVCSKSLKYKRKRDLVYIIFTEAPEQGDQVEITFYYHGKSPTILDEGPITWKEDANGKPWISTQTEGLGVGKLFPCKDLLIDEPDDVFITVTVPEGLQTAANGALKENSTSNGKTTTKWHVDNSINIYNISFNIGDFVYFTLPYEAVNGNAYDLGFYVLRENEAKARDFYNQTPKILRHAEELFGVYPWWNDGLKFVESTFSAMEHQGCIAMGSYYESDWQDINTTLAHEIAHEWWGNSITAADYSDIWLHEGMATYSEALIAERLFGKEEYLKYCRNTMYWSIANKRPIQKVPDVRYTSWANRADGDIYPKGAMLMHTLRTQMENDELFFRILKEANVRFKDQTISSTEFEAYFLENCQCELKPIFDVMLRQAEAPGLAYSVFLNETSKTAQLKFKWDENTPKNYPMIIAFIAGDEKVVITPTHELQTVDLPYDVEYKMQPWVSGYFIGVKLEL
ncbi:MAG: M1 family metallopeptidase [Flavobacteriales bacterium]